LSEQDYMPIACALHEHYQYAVMKSALLDLRWLTQGGLVRQARVLPRDVYTREGAEYLCVETREGEAIEIRLDRIAQAYWAADGTNLDPSGWKTTN
jgi:transcriptional antiterminator Rof (Rho-off)